MIDHLIFNKLKWFNIADNATTGYLDGRRYVFYPPKIKILQGTTMSSESYGNIQVLAGTAEVVGVNWIDGKQVYVCSSHPNDLNDAAWGNEYVTVPVSAVTPIWGGVKPS